MDAPKIVTVAPSQFPAVATFLRARKLLNAWKAKHAAAARELAELQKVYNLALKVAGAAVRAEEVASGPFDLYQWVRSDDGDALYEAVGRQKFASVGGLLETKEICTVDRDVFDLAVTRDEVKPDVVRAVVSYDPRYHAPKPIQLP